MPASEGPVWHAVLRASPLCLERPEGQQGCDGKDMVGKAAGIGMLLFDLAAGLLHQKPVEDVRCLTHGGGNVLGGEAPKLIGDLCEQEL